MKSLHHPDLRLLWTLWLCHLNVCLYFIQKPLIRPFAHKHTHWWQRATAYGEDSSACGQEEQGIDPPLWRTLCTSWATSATYASPMCLFDQMHERWTYKLEYQQKNKKICFVLSLSNVFLYVLKEVRAAPSVFYKDWHYCHRNHKRVTSPTPRNPLFTLCMLTRD